MRPYTPPTDIGRIKSRDDIHRKTCDGGSCNRVAAAKAQRKAARRHAVNQINIEISNLEE